MIYDRRIPLALPIIFSALALSHWIMLNYLTITTLLAWVVIYYGMFFWITWTGITAGLWIAGYITQLINEHLWLITKILDTTYRFNKDQRYFAVWVLGGDIDEPGTPEINDPTLIRLHTGASVDADALRTIAAGRVGESLIPERDIHHNRAKVRAAYQELSKADAIVKGDNTTGPKIKNPTLFEQIIMQVKG